MMLLLLRLAVLARPYLNQTFLTPLATHRSLLDRDRELVSNQPIRYLIVQSLVLSLPSSRINLLRLMVRVCRQVGLSWSHHYERVLAETTFLPLIVAVLIPNTCTS
jgi:hypothetical protein